MPRDAVAGDRYGDMSHHRRLSPSADRALRAQPSTSRAGSSGWQHPPYVDCPLSCILDVHPTYPLGGLAYLPVTSGHEHPRQAGHPHRHRRHRARAPRPARQAQRADPADARRAGRHRALAAHRPHPARRGARRERARRSAPGSTSARHEAARAASPRAFVPRPWRGTNTFQEACWAWRRLPVPVIAAVHGHCYGGGLQIALAADFRFATPDSEWSVLEGRWGIIPDMTGIQSLAELVGIDTAKRLTMTGADALRQGGRRPRPGHRARRRPGGRRRGLRPRAGDPLPRRSWPRRSGCSTRPGPPRPRRTFARERVEQLFLLFNANTKAAREAALKKVAPQFGPRPRR